MRLVMPPPAAAVRPGPAPPFTVVIAAYQAAAHLGDAIRSALEQSPPPEEVVVCDDGSTDGTGDVAAAFGPPVTVLRQRNGGEAAARNAAIRAARTDWVAILDADDVFLPGRLRALGESIAARPDLDIVTTDAWIEVDGRRRRRVYDTGFGFASSDQRAAILDDNFLFGLAAVRRARLLEVGGYDPELRYATDWDLWIRMVLTGSAAGLVDEPLALYRIQAGGLSSQRTRMLAGRIRVLEKTLGRSDLTSADRAVVTAALERLRRRHRVVAAQEALRERSAEARELALGVARDTGQPVATRVKALACAAAPGIARRVLPRRPVEITGGLHVPPARAVAAPRREEAARP